MFHADVARRVTVLAICARVLRDVTVLAVPAEGKRTALAPRKRPRRSHGWSGGRWPVAVSRPIIADAAQWGSLAARTSAGRISGGSSRSRSALANRDEAIAPS